MQKNKKFTPLLAIAALLIVSPGLAAEPANPPADAASVALDRLVEQRMQDAGIVGVGAAIIVDKRAVWTKGYGFADRDRKVAFTPDTVMGIASISKTVTGVALMRAVQDGKLSLDEDIDNYLPFAVRNPAFPAEPITLRQLATHTSSITDRWAVYERTYHYGDDVPESLGDFMEGYFLVGGKDYAKENFLKFKPGTHREYSNIAAALAGYIVERATGQRLDAYTSQRIFQPLKMDSTDWSVSGHDSSRHSKLYAAQGGLTIPIMPYALTTYADGGVRTSVADLSKFFIALLNGGEYAGVRILDTKTVDDMLRFQFTQANRPDNVRLDEKNAGIFWESKFNVTRMGYGGTDPGVKTEMLADLSKEIGVVLFANTSLCDEDMGKHAAIFNDIWDYAVKLETQRKGAVADQRPSEKPTKNLSLLSR